LPHSLICAIKPQPDVSEAATVIGSQFLP
jgi:hypothetical protein